MSGTHLKLPYEKALAIIEERVRLGRAIGAHHEGSTDAESVQDKLKPWNEYNFTLLQRVFTGGEVSGWYAHMSASLLLPRSAADFAQVLAEQIRKLDSLAGRLQLYPLQLDPSLDVLISVPRQVEVWPLHSHEQAAIADMVRMALPSMRPEHYVIKLISDSSVAAESLIAKLVDAFTEAGFAHPSGEQLRVARPDLTHTQSWEGLRIECLDAKDMPPVMMALKGAFDKFGLPCSVVERPYDPTPGVQNYNPGAAYLWISGARPDETKRPVPIVVPPPRAETVIQPASPPHEAPVGLSQKEHQPRRKKRGGSQVFVVHGHDEITTFELRDFLSAHGLKPILLRERFDRGLTVIEKLERDSKNVDFAVVCMTPDEVMYLAKDEVMADHERKKELRARPNVLLELGYFLNKLGRARVRIIVKENVSLPSDIYGILTLRLVGEFDAIKYKLLQDLLDAGLPVRSLRGTGRGRQRNAGRV